MKRLDEGWKADGLVRTFLDGIRGGIPLEKVQADVMLRLVEAAGAPPACFLDLGCGDGVLSGAVLAKYPASLATLVDFSEPMLKEASTRFAGSRNVRIVQADFATSDWLDVVKDPAPFDLVVSGYAIHHQEDERKRQLYAEIFSLLKPGGLFINMDHVASRSGLGRGAFDKYLGESLREFNEEKGTPEIYEKVQELTGARKDKEDETIATVEDQCEWLRASGFEDVDCFFKIFELALFAGRRPA